MQVMFIICNSLKTFLNYSTLFQIEECRAENLRRGIGGNQFRSITSALPFRHHQRRYCARFRRWWRQTARDFQPETVDKYSAILFPTAYFIFNVGYWGYYLSPLSAHEDPTF